MTFTFLHMLTNHVYDYRVISDKSVYFIAKKIMSSILIFIKQKNYSNFHKI